MENTKNTVLIDEILVNDINIDHTKKAAKGFANYINDLTWDLRNINDVLYGLKRFSRELKIENNHLGNQIEDIIYNGKISNCLEELRDNLEKIENILKQM